MQPPPNTTLFPYTTLFRSVTHSQDQRLSLRVFVGRATAAASTSDLDRKSTRLNSSHTVISYAVFCLKKKSDGRVERIVVERNRLEPREDGSLAARGTGERA